MTLFTTFLALLPFGAVPMVFYFGTLRTTAVCLGLLLLYVIVPFLYIGVLSFGHEDATLASAWQQMMEINILAPLVTTAVVLGMWISVGIAVGAVFKFAWSRWQARAAA